MTARNKTILLFTTVLLVLLLGISMTAAADTNTTQTHTQAQTQIEHTTPQTAQDIQSTDNNKVVKKEVQSNTTSKKVEKTVSNTKNIKNSQKHIVNQDNWQETFTLTNNTNEANPIYSLGDNVKDNDTLDFQGKLIVDATLYFNKTVNVVSTSNDSNISLNSTGSSGIPSRSFLIDNGAGNSVFTNISLYNTHVLVRNADNISFNNVSFTVENKTFNSIVINGSSHVSLNNNAMNAAGNNLGTFIRLINGVNTTKYVNITDNSFYSMNSCTFLDITGENISVSGNKFLADRQSHVSVSGSNISFSNNKFNKTNVNIRTTVSFNDNVLDNGSSFTTERNSVIMGSIFNNGFSTGANSLVVNNTIYCTGYRIDNVGNCTYINNTIIATGQLISPYDKDTFINNTINKINVDFGRKNITFINNNILHLEDFGSSIHINNTLGEVLSYSATFINNTIESLSTSGVSNTIDHNRINWIRVGSAANVTNNIINTVELASFADNSNITFNNITNEIISTGLVFSNVNIQNNRIINDNDYTIKVHGTNNIISNNYLISGTGYGSATVRAEDNNILENNTPTFKTFNITDDNYNNFFDKNGVLNNSDVTNYSNIYLNGQFNNKNFTFKNIIVNILGNDAVLNDATIKITDNSRISIRNITVNNKNSNNQAFIIDTGNNFITNMTINHETNLPTVHEINITGNKNTLENNIITIQSVADLSNTHDITAVVVTSNNSVINNNNITVTNGSAIKLINANNTQIIGKDTNLIADNTVIILVNSNNTIISSIRGNTTSKYVVTLQQSSGNQITGNVFNANNLLGGNNAVYLNSSINNTIESNTPRINVLTNETYPLLFNGPDNSFNNGTIDLLTLNSDLHDVILSFNSPVTFINNGNYTIYNGTIKVIGSFSGSNLTISGININNTNKEALIVNSEKTSYIKIHILNSNITVNDGNNISAINCLYENNKYYHNLNISNTNIILSGSNITAINYSGRYNQPASWSWSIDPYGEVRVTYSNITVNSNTTSQVMNLNHANIYFNHNNIMQTGKDIITVNGNDTVLYKDLGFQYNNITANGDNVSVLNINKSTDTRISDSNIKHNTIILTSPNPITAIKINGTKNTLENNNIIINTTNEQQPVITINGESNQVINNYIQALDMIGDNTVNNTGVTIRNNTPTDKANYQDKLNIKTSGNTINKDINITTTITDVYGRPINGTFTFIIENSTVATISGSNATTTYTPRTSGNITIKVLFTDNTGKYLNNTEIIIVNIPKLETTITLTNITGTIENNTQLTAVITDSNGDKVITGRVTFSVNGSELKDEKGNIIYVDVTNGIATLNYTVPYTWLNYNTAVTNYIGDEIYESSNTTGNLTINRKTVNMEINILNSNIKPGETAIIMVTVTDKNGNMVKSGKVIFKLNGKSLRDENGNTITVRVHNGIAIFKYTVPANFSAKNYTLTAISVGNTYNRVEAVTNLTLTRINTYIQNINTQFNGNTLHVQANIISTTTQENVAYRETKVTVKINNKTFVKEAKVTNGTINLDIDTSSIGRGNYKITIKTGDNGIYTGTQFDIYTYKAPVKTLKTKRVLLNTYTYKTPVKTLSTENIKEVKKISSSLLSANKRTIKQEIINKEVTSLYVLENLVKEADSKNNTAEYYIKLNNITYLYGPSIEWGKANGSVRTITIDGNSQTLPESMSISVNKGYTLILKNIEIKCKLLNKGNLTLINATLKSNQYLENNGVLNITNSRLNNSIYNDEGSLIIDENTIFGENTDISGKGLLITNNSHVINVITTYNGNYTLKNMFISNPKTNYGNLTLINSTLKNRIYNYGNLTLINLTLNNTIYNYNTLIIDDNTVLTDNLKIYSTKDIISNKSMEKYLVTYIGNHVFNKTIFKAMDNYGNLTLINLNITKNFINGGNLTLINCSISNITSKDNYFLKNTGNLSIINTTFMNINITCINSTGTLDIINSTFKNVTEAVSALHSNIINSNFINNKIGVISTGNIVNCIFNNNTQDLVTGNATITNTTFVNGASRGTINGINHDRLAGVYVDGNVTIDNCTFRNKTGRYIYVYGGSSTFYGQALHVRGENILINNTLFDSNYLYSDDHWSYYGGAAIGADTYVKNLTISNCVFNNNKIDAQVGITGPSDGACGDGADIFMILESSTQESEIIIKNNTFNNSTSVNGASGSIYITKSLYDLLNGKEVNVTITNNTFNNVKSTNDTIHITVNNVILTNNTYNNCSIEFTNFTLNKPGKVFLNTTMNINGNIALAHPNYYDKDILNKNKYEFYIGNKLYSIEDNFNINFQYTTDNTIIYAKTTIASAKTNTLILKSSQHTIGRITPRNYDDYVFEGELIGLTDDSIVYFNGNFTNKKTISLTTPGLIIHGENAIFTNTSFSIDEENITIMNMNINNTDTSEYAIKIGADNSQIINNTIYTYNRHGKTAAISNSKASNTLIKNNTIITYGPGLTIDYTSGAAASNTQGILTIGGENNTITNNNIKVYNSTPADDETYGTIEGITAHGLSNNILISNNTIFTTGGRFNYGIDALYNINNTRIQNNTIYVTGHRYIDGIQIGNSATNCLVTGNTMTGTCYNKTVFINDDEPLAFGIIATGTNMQDKSNNITITNNTINMNASIVYGMEIYQTENSTIANNTIIENGNYTMGLSLAHSPYDKVINNTMILQGNSNIEINYIVEEIRPANTGIQVQQESSDAIIANNTIKTYDVGGKDIAINVDNEGVTVTNNKLTTSIANGNSAVTRKESTVIITNNTQAKLDTTITLKNKTTENNTTITVNLTDEFNHPVTTVISYTINNKQYNTTTNNGITTINIPPNTNTITINYPGNNIYNPTNTTLTFNITKTNTIITASNITAHLGDNIILNATIKDSNGNPITTGEILIKLNGKSIAYTNITQEGKIKYNLQLTPDKYGKEGYTVTYVYAGSNTTASARVNTTLTVIPYTPKIELNINNAEIGDTVIMTIKITNGQNYNALSGNIRFKINGITYKINKTPYKVQVTNGTATLKFYASKKFIGYNNITILYSGNGKFNAISQVFTNKLHINQYKQTKIQIKPVTTKIGQNMTIKANITDKNGNPVTKGTVAIKINGKTFGHATINKGQITYTLKIDPAKFSTKNYTLTIKFGGKGKYQPATTNTTLTIIKNTPKITYTTVNTKNTTKLTVKITDGQLKANNGTIGLKINGQTYKINKNPVIIKPVNGTATFNINTKNLPKNNNITITYSGDKQFNGIKQTYTNGLRIRT